MAVESVLAISISHGYADIHQHVYCDAIDFISETGKFVVVDFISDRGNTDESPFLIWLANERRRRLRVAYYGRHNRRQDTLHVIDSVEGGGEKK